MGKRAGRKAPRETSGHGPVSPVSPQRPRVASAQECQSIVLAKGKARARARARSSASRIFRRFFFGKHAVAGTVFLHRAIGLLAQRSRARSVQCLEFWRRRIWNRSIVLAVRQCQGNKFGLRLLSSLLQRHLGNYRHRSLSLRCQRRTNSSGGGPSTLSSTTTIQVARHILGLGHVENAFRHLGGSLSRRGERPSDPVSRWTWNFGRRTQRRSAFFGRRPQRGPASLRRSLASLENRSGGSRRSVPRRVSAPGWVSL